MQPVRTIVCLANSRKYGGRCIAGIDPETGAWIRPVSSHEKGEIPVSRQKVGDRDLELMELVRLPLHDNGPNFGFECENLLLKPGQWRVIGKVDPSDLIRFCSDEGEILHNALPYVFESDLHALIPEKRKTLGLYETVSFSAKKVSEVNSQAQWMAIIKTTGGARLSAKITDMKFIERLERGHEPGQRCLVTVSVGMPFLPKSWAPDKGKACWKMIAGVIELPPTGTTGKHGVVGTGNSVARASSGEETLSDLELSAEEFAELSGLNEHEDEFDDYGEDEALDELLEELNDDRESFARAEEAGWYYSDGDSDDDDEISSGQYEENNEDDSDDE